MFADPLILNGMLGVSYFGHSNFEFVSNLGFRASDFLPRCHADLEQFWPILAGHKQAIAFGIVGDTVQYGISVRAVGQQPTKIDPSGDLAGFRRDAGRTFVRGAVGGRRHAAWRSPSRVLGPQLGRRPPVFSVIPELRTSFRASASIPVRQAGVSYWTRV